MLTNRQNRGITYFISRALFIGGGIANIFVITGPDAWISVILGTILGIFFIYLINNISSNLKVPLNIYLKSNTPLNIAIKLIFLLFYSHIIFITLLSITILVSSYFLPYTPPIFISIPFLLLALLITKKGFKCLGKFSEIFFYICIIPIITSALLLLPSFDITSFFPIFTTNSNHILIASLFFATLSATPHLLMLNEKRTLKSDIIHYLIAVISLLIVFLITSGVLGESLIKMYSYPEYVVLRKIQAFNFSENIENIIAFIWIIDAFITLSAASIKLTTEVITKKYSLHIIYLIILLIINFVIVKHFGASIIVYKYFIYILLILFILLILLLLIKKRTKSFKSNEIYK
ncbi:MAG: GerAB/ArcD/ProY family transporter [Bacilli bacterium]